MGQKLYAPNLPMQEHENSAILVIFRFSSAHALKWYMSKILLFGTVSWLIVLGFNTTLTAKIISWAVGDAQVFPGFLTLVLIQHFFSKPPTTFLTCFCRGEGQKYTEKKVRLNRGSNSQPLGYESDMLTTEPPPPPPSLVQRWSIIFLCSHSYLHKWNIKVLPLATNDLFCIVWRSR